MTFTPATLELAEEELAVCILKSGGQEQLFCCYEHGLIGTEADRVMPGRSWVG